MASTTSTSQVGTSLGGVQPMTEPLLRIEKNAIRKAISNAAVMIENTKAKRPANMRST